MAQVVRYGSFGLPKVQMSSLLLETCNNFIFGVIASCTNLLNRSVVSPLDFPPSPDGGDFYIILNDLYVLSARHFPNFPQGHLSLSDPQRTWMSVSLQDLVDVRLYDPFTEGGHRFLGSVDAEIGFAGKKSTEAPFDQDELAMHFTKVNVTFTYFIKSLLIEL